MPADPQIAVVIPCHNEEDYVAGVVGGIPDFVRTVVVVEDGSTDGTRRVIESLEDPRLVPILHDESHGFGGAMIAGYRAALEAGADVVVKMDGDGQMWPEDLEKLLAPVLEGRADYAKGNRFAQLKALQSMPRVRLLGNSALSFLTKLASGYWSIFDPTNGYTAIRRQTLEQLDLGRLSKKWFFQIDILIDLNIQGAVIRDVDIPARYADEKSDLHEWTIARKWPFLLAWGLLRRFYWRYVIRDFNVLTLCTLAGIPLLVFGVAFGAYHWTRSVQTGVPATAGTVLLAALPVILGFQCLLTALALDVLYQPRR